jgi:Dyp-type peroxidase family
MAFDRTKGEPQLALDEIQGDVLVGLQKDFEWFIGFNIEPAQLAAFKLFLRDRLTPLITTMRQTLQHENQVNAVKHLKPLVKQEIVSVNVGFSFKGLTALKVPGIAQILDAPFKAGLAASSPGLNDPTAANSEGAPVNWKVGGPKSEVDGLLLITGPSQSSIDLMLKQIELFAGATWKITYREAGTTRFLDRGHEHFGFLDAVSQPGVRGEINQVFPPQKFLQQSQNPSDPGQALPGSDLLWPGEFVFGYPAQKPDDIDNPGALVSAGPDWMKNGSFMAFRRLKQFVPEFDKFVATTSAARNMDEDLLGARLVGRWKSGAPVSTTPLQDDRALAGDELERNDFEFDSDPAGRRCPFAAHIRKAYPRNDITPPGLSGSSDFAKREASEANTQTHRILRRGIPFGPELSDEERAAEQTQNDRGLMFVCYQTSLDDQFEFIQKNWFNKAEFAPAGNSPGFDPLLGQNATARTTRPFKGAVPNFPSGASGEPINVSQEFVVPTGGGYFFMPSITTLHSLFSE